MPDAAFYENCWNELLKASRTWQLQWDIQQLLVQVCRTAQELLAVERAAAFTLSPTGLLEIARWPEAPGDATETAARMQVAKNVVQAGRTAVSQQQLMGDAVRTMMCAPLTAPREILGALYVESSRTERQITEKDQQFLEVFASQAAGCLEHTLLYQSAITDPLTGLFCHRYFQQEVEQAIRRGQRNERPVSLLLMDLDHFKALNDSCGHEVGNQCLIQVANILRSSFRSTDILARFGGDEFEIVLPDTDPVDGMVVAEKARERIASVEFPQNRRVAATIGIAAFPENAGDAQALFLHADSALYSAKQAGRNRVIRAAGKSELASSLANPSRLAATGPVVQKLEARPTPQNGAEMIDGHRVLRRLGVGSSGEVLLVTQPELDREVALKRPLTPHLSLQQTQAFEQEAKVTAGMNHPGVVPIFSIGRDQDQRRYYTMKPLQGTSLAQLIESRCKGNMDSLHHYSLGRLLEILQRVSETIAYAHKRSVLHLDLNPGNVLVGEFGDVTVIDWSREASAANWRNPGAATKDFDLVGSPAFVAPEILRGGKEKVSAAADVFALGTMLYYLLTSELPFRRANTAQTVAAILSGEVCSPDTLRPEAGIDSVLSELCLEALAVDPQRRPAAQAFAERLALCIRHEMDWTAIRFGNGPGEQPLLESDWHPCLGEWKFEGDHWRMVSGATGGLLLWKNPVPGSFRFSCEGWVDRSGAEISIVGHRPPPESRNYSPEGGYYFQLGAECNSVTKLSRNRPDVLIQPCGALEPGRRYRLELQYQDQEGLIICAIDNKRVFTFRELFPFAGNQLGFYGFGGGSHYRPIQVARQNWNLQIPALRAADRHFAYGHYEEALECYREVAEHKSKRNASMEATLKVGLCLAARQKVDQAIETMHSLAGTPFEPFALAEEAALYMRIGHLDKGQKLFEHLFEKYPDSQARIRVFDISALRLINGHTAGYASFIRSMIAINLLGATKFTPGYNAFRCQKVKALAQTRLGYWEEALRNHIAFGGQLADQQRNLLGFYNETLAFLTLACGREDLLPDYFDGVESFGDGYISHHFHLALRKPATREAALQFSRKKGGETVALLFALASKDLNSANVALDALIVELVRIFPYFLCGSILCDARIPELWKRFLKTSTHTHPACLSFLKARYALEQRDFAAAAECLADSRPDVHLEGIRPVYVLQTLLSSLGYLKNPAPQQLKNEIDQYVCGPLLELARMFLGEIEPKPTALWPHPRWHPEWRLWLGLWLEAKGRPREAHDVVLPSRDPRYGWTFCQPAIELLLQRTS